MNETMLKHIMNYFTPRWETQSSKFRNQSTRMKFNSRIISFSSQSDHHLVPEFQYVRAADWWFKRQ